MVALGVCTANNPHEGGLGYMAGMFHLFTHAMFKALLFLGAGCIIHAVHSNEMSTWGTSQVYAYHSHYIPHRMSGHCRYTSILWFLLERRNSDSLLPVQSGYGMDNDNYCRNDSILHVPLVLWYLLGN